MRCRGYAISHIGNSRETHANNYLLGEQFLYRLVKFEENPVVERFF